ncbi:MAG TPA: PIG-L family deacetylase, partial [Anaeromyxobacter sp.]|nr:PIG-L family deacetylase [Anaeromyxobacter sp.]
MSSRPGAAHRLLESCLVAALCTFATPASARTVMVVAPHPDDETLIAGGRIRAAIDAGDTVVIAIMTNGDLNGVDVGLMREGESVAAAGILGLPEQDVIFLGYGDSALQGLWQSASGSQVYASPAGMTATYGARGLGGLDFHTYLTGAPAPYSRDSVLFDLEALFSTYRPDDVYTTAWVDEHGDHAATGYFVREALVALQKQGAALPTRLNESVVWVEAPAPGELHWPQVDDTGFVPGLPFYEPACCLAQTPFAWSRIQQFPVPPEMQSTDPATSLKYLAINAYTSQLGPWLTSFARKDEFFWVTDVGGNRALTATVTVSSEDTAGGNAGARATDGIADGGHQWRAQGERDGAWLQLSWPAPVVLSQVNLYDLTTSWDNVLQGTLSFSDGSAVPVGPLPIFGQVAPVTFPPRAVTWVRFTIDSAQGLAGLSEIEAYGPSSPDDTPPRFLAGPAADQESIFAWGAAAFTLQGWDLDGDPLSAIWSVDGGTVDNQGGTAVFSPPLVATPTVFTVTAQLLDGRGGTATGTGYVTVQPSVDGLGVTPTGLLGGDPVQGLVTLASPAPSGGLSVPLSSSSPAALAPAAVLVPEGALSAGFSVTTSPVATATPVVLGAQIGGATPTSSFTIFPPSDSTNLAPDATVTVSSEIAGQEGINAIDGVVDGFPDDPSREWAANGKAGEWIQLAWPAPVILGQVTLHDRVNLTDQILAARLLFSDGSVVSVGALPNDGTGLPVRFPARSVTSVQLVVDRASGTSTGLAEIEAYSPKVDALVLSPDRVAGGFVVQGTLNLIVPGDGETVVLTSSDPAAQVPDAVTIPPGAASATFSITTAEVPDARSITITAAFARGPRTAQLTLAPVELASLSFSPPGFLGGGGSLGTVTLSVVPPRDTVVSLASDTQALVVPETVTVPAGATAVTFLAFSGPVPATTEATVLAGLGTSSTSGTVTLFPIPGDADLARTAQVTVSSENAAAGQLGTSAIDGVIGGYPGDTTKEWATQGEGAGAWIQLHWSTPVTLEEARLYDRPNLVDQVLSGRLIFSDGS